MNNFDDLFEQRPQAEARRRSRKAKKSAPSANGGR